MSLPHHTTQAEAQEGQCRLGGDVDAREMVATTIPERGYIDLTSCRVNLRLKVGLGIGLGVGRCTRHRPALVMELQTASTHSL
ncbi:hypothetical protein SALBM311S_11028 [Streptomyces alboniger]